MKKLATKFITYTLKRMAKKLLKKNNFYIIAITGSVGKTSTKEMVFEVLKEKFGKNVRKSEGNLNTEIGLPLSILGFKKVPSKLFWPVFLIWAYLVSIFKHYSKYLILEMGVDKPRDMDYFLDFVNPKIGIITALSQAHLENFKDLEEMRAEKLKLFEKINSNGARIFNGDDEYFRKNPQKDGCEYSLRNINADCVADNIEINEEGTVYKVICEDKEFKIKNSLLGKQFVYSGLAAICVAKFLNVSDKMIEDGLSNIKPVNGRLNLLNGKKKTKILDDTYNSSPASVKSALDTLEGLGKNYRRVAILGNMNELGKYEKEAHREIGSYAKEKVNLAVFIGPNADIMAKGYGAGKFLVYKNKEEFFKDIDEVILEGDFILIKASQNNNYFEEITKYLLSEDLDPKKVLVRQTKFWLKKKGIR